MKCMMASAAKPDPRPTARKILATRTTDDVVEFEPASLAVGRPVAHGATGVCQHVLSLRYVPILGSPHQFFDCRFVRMPHRLRLAAC